MSIYLESPPTDALEQGDVLQKTPAIQELLTKYHPYYAQHDENKFFVVLTQSCDLVRRSAHCGARYIALAPIRPLKTIVRREFEGKLENVQPGAQPFGSQRTRVTFEQFLNRLFNNNEPPFFYFEAAHQRGIYEDMCAMLALPISLKPEHYEALLAAKLAGISDVFQAKLGWLLGQMYSRVGTPDLPPATMSKRVKEYTEGAAIWLEDQDAKALRALLQSRADGGNAGPASRTDLAALIKQLPKKKAQAIDAVLSIATTQGLIEAVSPARLAFRRALEKDPIFAKLF